jgi:catechol 2,3-dioxygenase-like lactoylglutathione lyase family enzyme
MLRRAALTAFLATTNPARAKVFYRDILGLSLLSDDQFALAFDANGTQLRIQKVEKLEPHPFTSLGWHVPDIAKAVAELVKHGVTFERYEFMKQDKLGVWKAPSGAKVAWFKDPDENLISLTEARAP